MNSNLVSMLRMKGWRCPIHIRRASATSGRFCQVARKSFFVCQAKVAQMPPNRDTVGLDALDFPQFDHQFIKGKVALFPDPAPDPVRHASQPCPPQLPCFLASSEPVVGFKMTMSLTNLIETRNCAAFAIALGPMARR